MHKYQQIKHTVAFTVYVSLFFFFFTLSSQAQKQPYETQGHRLTLLPLAGFSSDDGIGYGFRGNLYQYDGQTIPYQKAYALQFFFTTKGKWTHRIMRLDYGKTKNHQSLYRRFAHTF